MWGLHIKICSFYSCPFQAGSGAVLTTCVGERCLRYTDGSAAEAFSVGAPRSFPTYKLNCFSALDTEQANETKQSAGYKIVFSMNCFVSTFRNDDA